MCNIVHFSVSKRSVFGVCTRLVGIHIHRVCVKIVSSHPFCLHKRTRVRLEYTNALTGDVFKLITRIIIIIIIHVRRLVLQTPANNVETLQITSTHVYLPDKHSERTHSDGGVRRAPRLITTYLSVRWFRLYVK